MTDRNELRPLGGGDPRDERFAHYFIRSPELDPDEITRLTGIEPDRMWHLGDAKPRTGISHVDGYWSVESGLTPSDECHDHLEALLGRLRPAWSTFVDLGRRYEAGVDVAIYLHGQGPLVQLLPDVARELSELGATLGFDLYALPDDNN